MAGDNNKKRKLPNGIFSETQRVALITKTMGDLANLMYDDESFAANFQVGDLTRPDGSPVKTKILVVQAPKQMFTVEAKI